MALQFTDDGVQPSNKLRYIGRVACLWTALPFASCHIRALADQRIVLGMRADPDPQNTIIHIDPQRPVMKADPYGPEAGYLLEMKGRMLRV